MAIWICRAGLHGEYAKKFLGQEKMFLIGSVSMDLTGKTDMEELMKVVSRTYPTEPDGSVVTMSVQARAFAVKAKVGDWVVLPVKDDDGKKLLHVGEITGAYVYDGTKSELKHSHTVVWKYGTWEYATFDDDIQRTLDAFDSFMLFFKMKQEKRFKEIVKKGKPIAKIARPKPEPKQKEEPKPEPVPEPVKEEPAPAPVAEEPKKSVNKPEPEPESEPEVVYIEVERDYDDDDAWRCPCGRKNVVCCKYNKWYYDILKARRRFRR
jgi:predicted Mrr-cat superfamily restriction endonuclease